MSGFKFGQQTNTWIREDYYTADEHADKEEILYSICAS